MPVIQSNGSVQIFSTVMTASPRPLLRPTQSPVAIKLEEPANPEIRRTQSLAPTNSQMPAGTPKA